MLILNTITDAMIEIGVISQIDEATPQDHDHGLRTLNRIIDSYNTQNLMVTYLQDIALTTPSVINECETADPSELNAKAWKNTVIIGPCQDINMTAPTFIEGLFWRQQGATDYHSKEMTYSQWSKIITKGNETIPRRHYVQRMEDNNVKIYFDYIPTKDLELHLLAKMPYTGKNSVGDEYLPTDDIQWTRGFEKMLMLRLAVELCGAFEIQPSQMLISKAMEAEDNIKAFNSQPLTLGSDLSLFGSVRVGNSGWGFGTGRGQG